MPRQQSSSKTSTTKSSNFHSTPRPHSPLAPPVPPLAPPPQTVQIQPPGFFSSMWQGFGLGAGSSIAHNMFDSPKTVIHKNEEPIPKYTGPCAKQKETFDKCIEHRQTIEECERILKDLHACYDEHSLKQHS